MAEADLKPIAPAFSGKRERYAFLALAFALLIFPLIPKADWFDRSDEYRLPEVGHWDPLYFIDHVLKGKGDIDLLILGHSSVETGLNLPLIRSELERKLGRTPEIAIYSHWGRDPALEYIVLKDILRRRSVNVMLWQINYGSDWTLRRPATDYNLPWDLYEHRGLLSKFDVSAKVSVYLSSVRRVLRSIYTRLETPHSRLLPGKCVERDKYLGGCPRPMEGLNILPPTTGPGEPLSTLVHHRVSGDPLLEIGPYYTPDEALLSNAVIHLARSHGVQMAFIQTPFLPDDRKKLPEIDSVLVPHLLDEQDGRGIPILGIPLSRLFPGETGREIVEHYFRVVENHLHARAALYFTRTMIPAILSLFDPPPPEAKSR